MSLLLIFVSLLSALIATLFLFVKKSRSYWQLRGVPYKKPTFLFGNFSDTFLKKKSFAQNLADLYNESSDPFFGIYTPFSAGLLIRDPQLMKLILIKDFHHFDAPGVHASADVDPMADSILHSSGEKWKRIRGQLSPAFSVGKIRGMCQSIVSYGTSLEKHIRKFSDSNKPVEMRQLFSNFGANVVASVTFGIEIDCFEHSNNEFRKYLQKALKPTLRNIIRTNLHQMSPKLVDILGVRFVDKDIGDFMIECVRQNYEYREKNNIFRKDFFQLLMQIRNAGHVKDDNNWTTEATTGQKAITIENMAAQSFLLFLGGFDSTSSAMSFLLYELAKNGKIQQIVYEEIETVLQKHNAELTYDAVNDMKYLECCIQGAILHVSTQKSNQLMQSIHRGLLTKRKNISCNQIAVFGVSRRCTKDYKIPDTDVTIEKGTLIWFSSLGLHYDAKYYDQPDKFIPERFNDSRRNEKDFIEMPNLSFGNGLRNCIGATFAKLLQ